MVTREEQDLASLESLTGEVKQGYQALRSNSVVPRLELRATGFGWWQPAVAVCALVLVVVVFVADHDADTGAGDTAEVAAITTPHDGASTRRLRSPYDGIPDLDLRSPPRPTQTASIRFRLPSRPYIPSQLNPRDGHS